MPPYFVYLLALTTYCAVACAVWVIAAVLTIPQRTRPLGKKIAFSMAGSFPGVFLFQLLAAPLAGFILVSIGGIIWIIQPTDSAETVLFVLLLLGTVGLIAVASLLGFYAGWRIVWEWTAGRPVQTFLLKDPVLGPVIRFLLTKFPIVESVLPV
jgi:hypothetical protein